MREVLPKENYLNREELIGQVADKATTWDVLVIGGGATGLITNSVGVRFDVRHLRSLSKDAALGLVGRRISYTRFTIGLLLRL